MTLIQLWRWFSKVWWHGGDGDANIDGHVDLQRWTRAADTLDQGTSYIPSLLDILRQIEDEQ